MQAGERPPLAATSPLKDLIFPPNQFSQFKLCRVDAFLLVLPRYLFPSERGRGNLQNLFAVYPINIDNGINRINLSQRAADYNAVNNRIIYMVISSAAAATFRSIITQHKQSDNIHRFCSIIHVSSPRFGGGCAFYITSHHLRHKNINGSDKKCQFNAFEI
jgi:hypothetical protein